MEENTAEIISIASTELNVRYDTASLSWISRPGFKGDVADAAAIFKINGENRSDDAIFIVSNPQHPDFVQAAVDKADQVRARLEPDLARPVLCPRFSGRDEGRSFAVYPVLRPISANPLLGTLQKRLLQKSVTRWIGALCRASRRTLDRAAEIDALFIRPLSYIEGQGRFSKGFREAAAQAAAAIERNEFSPVTCIQHGDFWYGNVLLNGALPLPGSRARFSVIDWGGARIDGYPFLDSLSFSQSCKRSDTAGRHILRDYAHHAGVPAEHALHYVCAGLGRLGLNRNEFPLNRYIPAAQKHFSRTRDLFARG